METNLLPAYIEKGLIREKYNSIVFRSQELSFDVFGNSYVIGDNSDSLFVLDMDGKIFQILLLCGRTDWKADEHGRWRVDFSML